MLLIKNLIKDIFVPELSLILIFALVGFFAGEMKISSYTELFEVLSLVLIGFFVGSKLINNYFNKNRLDVRATDRVLVIVGLIFVICPPVIAYKQGTAAMISCLIMFFLVAMFEINHTSFQETIRRLPGVDILLSSISWGVMTIVVSHLYLGFEASTRSWLITLLGFYIYSSFYLLNEVTSSKSLKERASIVMYLGESKSLELVSLLSLFGVVGLTTLYLSEYDYISTYSFVFYLLFTVISLAGVFLTLVWSKNSTHKKGMNRLLYLIAINSSLTCWVIAEWLALN